MAWPLLVGFGKITKLSTIIFLLTILSIYTFGRYVLLAVSKLSKLNSLLVEVPILLENHLVIHR